ncbi:MAG: hypothetical protein KDA37_15805, partial [Planctomycetales bacterium]|nr:hypothetical protein [Planctomycetales bacterium]
MRHNSPLAWMVLGAALLGSAAQAQESKEHYTFVEKLASRFGWGEEQEDQPQASESTTGPRGTTSRLSRFNPGALLPGQMFSGGSNRSAAAKNRSQAPQQDPASAAGSARARLVRDLRSQPAPNQQMRVASRAPAESASQRTASPPAADSPNPTVLSRSSSTRVGSRFVDARPEEKPATSSAPSAQQGQAALSEAALRQELMVSSPLAGADKPRADARTTKAVAAAVAESLSGNQAASAPKAPTVEQLLRAETSKPVAAEVYAQPEDRRGVDSAPLPTSEIKTAPVSRRRYAASSLPEFAENPSAERAVAKPDPAAQQALDVAPAKKSVAQPSFEQLVESRDAASAPADAQQAFVEPQDGPANQLRVEQSVEARTAPVDVADVWNAPRTQSQPPAGVAAE